MSKRLIYLSSTLGRKFLMALTGLALVGFVLVHLGGNLLLLLPDPDYFNEYAHRLESLGGLLYLAEAGLALAFLIHIFTAVAVSWGNRRAREDSYRKSADAGRNSYKSFSSVSMIWTGLILLAFLVWHLWHFKFGAGVGEGYVTRLASGERVRDLHRLVVESFQIEYFVGIYLAVMILLGLHVRHGFWSAFQSLGLHHPRYTPWIYSLGVVLAILLALGFLGIPLWIYLGGGV